MHEGGAQPKSSCIRCTSCGHESRIISIHVSWQPLRPSLNRNFIKKIKACDKRFTWTVGRLASPGSSNTCRGHNLRQWPASIWIISPDIPEEIKIKKKKIEREKELVLAIKAERDTGWFNEISAGLGMVNCCTGRGAFRSRKMRRV